MKRLSFRSLNRIALPLFCLGFILAAGAPAQAGGGKNVFNFAPCSPDSEYSEDAVGPLSSTSLGFCADWNPEFANNGNHCCGKPSALSRRRRPAACDPHRRKYVYCDEMTDDQREFISEAEAGKTPDALQLVDEEISRKRSQAFCSVSTGFLVAGRPVIPSGKNRIQLRDSRRCTEFGTDQMAGMLEWAGRVVAKEYSAPEYSGVRLLLGDISAPRGGCLSGRGGRRGHKSHTTGQDVDVGYLTVRANHASPEGFHRDFDAKTNWWLLKKLFANPYACVKVVFLDKRNIRKLAKFAWSDPEWKVYGRYIRHIAGHRDHMHVRIGDGPGLPGCKANTDKEIEDQLEGDEEASAN